MCCFILGAVGVRHKTRHSGEVLRLAKPVMRCNGIIPGAGPFRSRLREDYPGRTEELEMRLLDKYGSLGIDRRRKSRQREPREIKKVESYPELADPQLRPRYRGIPTFFRLPHIERLEEVDIVLIDVPFDGGVINRAGARHGPRDIRSQSSVVRKNCDRGIGSPPLSRPPRPCWP